jgi:ribosomal protein L27
LLVALAIASGAPAAAGAGPPSSSTMLRESTNAGRPAAGARAVLGAPQPGSGGWYWPVGTEDFQGWSGWLDKRGSYVHVAQDMPCAVGHPVYAIADGVVFISRADAGGYGVGGAPGGCVIIAHVTASGTKFHALYGHVQALKVKAGQRVSAGQVIASVNGCRHLHFSTHIGFTYRDGNPYAGHVPASWTDHGGYVDPVKFLKTNPRSAPYKPPPLPLVEVSTQAPPQQFGAAAGAAYWTEEGAAGSVIWRQDLASGRRGTLGAGETVPPFDTRRYVTALLASPAQGFTVGDRLPILTLSAAQPTPPWGTDAELDALLTNAAGSPLQGGVLKLQLLNGDAWENVRLGVTDAGGAAVFLYSPAAATVLRVVFTPPATQPAGSEYLAARTRSLTVTPQVALTTPKVPPAVERDALITVAGDLTPKHPAGAASVQLVFQRRVAGGEWVTRSTVAAVNRDVAASDCTRYVGHARLAPGSWRVQAVHPADGEHAETSTAWRSFTVQ